MKSFIIVVSFECPRRVTRDRCIKRRVKISAFLVCKKRVSNVLVDKTVGHSEILSFSIRALEEQDGLVLVSQFVPFCSSSLRPSTDKGT